MKYERLTKETVGSFGYDLKDFEHKPKEFNDYDAFYAYKMAVKRLGELEDKIESGELISTVQSEQGEQEIAFFAKHNARVRKQAVQEFADHVEIAFHYEFDGFIPSIMADKIDEIVKEVCGNEKRK